MKQLIIAKQITTREELSLDKYLNEIGKIDLLTPDEEIELAKEIKNGEKAALEKLVSANLRFVVSVAKQYQNKGLSLPDLINEGNLGLIKAAQKYDETRGFKFISYAVWWIRQSIMQALADQARLVRLPMNKLGSIHKINNTYRQLSQEFLREPSSEEVALALETSADEVEDALNTSSHHISMDAPIYSEGENSLYDVLLDENSSNPDDNLMQTSLDKEIERSLSKLSEREAEIIRYYFGLGGKNQHTLEEIAFEFGLTKERVRQIKELTMKKMRYNYGNALLRAYL